MAISLASGGVGIAMGGGSGGGGGGGYAGTATRTMGDPMYTQPTTPTINRSNQPINVSVYVGDGSDPSTALLVEKQTKMVVNNGN